jgi:hypothetical protein
MCTTYFKISKKKYTFETVFLNWRRKMIHQCQLSHLAMGSGGGGGRGTSFFLSPCDICARSPFI